MPILPRRHLLLFRFCLLIALFSGQACSSSSVLYDYNTKARFTEYQTFSWLEADVSSQLIEAVDRVIRDSILKVLEVKDMRYASEGGDLLVLHHAGHNDRVSPDRYGYSYWPDRWGYGGYYQEIDQYQHKEGTLIIDFIDRRRKQLVWRGSAPKVLRRSTTDALADKIGASIRQVLDQYPPRD